MSAFVRTAAPSDARALAELVVELGYPCTADEARARLAALGSSPADAVFVAVAGGEPVGLASLHLIPLLHQARPLARVTAFVVAPSARRRGIGRLLLGACEGHARACGADRLELTSSDHRLGAHEFYSSSGFTREAQRFVKRLLAH